LEDVDRELVVVLAAADGIARDGDALGELGVEQPELGVDTRRGRLDASEPVHQRSGMPRPETGKFAIALRVSGPYSSLIGSSLEGSQRVSFGIVGGADALQRATRARILLRVILLVAATEGELVQLPGTRAFACGLGPSMRLATRAALLEADAQACWHVGIAGARRGSGIPLLALVIGSESIYSDHRLRARPSPVATPDAALVAAACRALPERSCAGSRRAPGRRRSRRRGRGDGGLWRPARGAGRRRPALEVRVVSNEVEEQDRANWMFIEAFAALHAMLPGLVEEVAACTS